MQKDENFPALSILRSVFKFQFRILSTAVSFHPLEKLIWPQTSHSKLFFEYFWRKYEKGMQAGPEAQIMYNYVIIYKKDITIPFFKGTYSTSRTFGLP
jgi:hypothetical protein